MQCHQQQCVEGRWSGSHQQHLWRAERTGAVFGMISLSTGCDQGGAQLCSCNEDVSSWGSQAGCGRDRGLDWCLLGVRSSRNPFSGISADPEGAAPSQAAQLLLLHCFTAGMGGRNLGVTFFFFFLLYFFIIFNRPTHSPL